MKNKRFLMITMLSFFVMTLTLSGIGQNDKNQSGKVNIAVLAKSSGSARGGAPVAGLNDGLTPNIVPDAMRQRAANPNQSGNRRPQRLTAQWVQYEWVKPVTIDEVAIFFYNFDNLAKLPQVYRLKYWDGNDYVPVNNVVGLGLVNNQYNSTTFKEVTTTRLRLEIDSVDRFASTILEWKALKTLNSPDVAPVVTAGIDRDVMVGGKTYLSADIKAVAPIKKSTWTATGPAKVEFADPTALVTTAKFTVPGDYLLTLSTQAGTTSTSSSLKAKQAPHHH